MQDAVPCALAFAVGSLNIPVLRELLGYDARSPQAQQAALQDGCLATDMLLRAVTASRTQACCPLKLGWSRANDRAKYSEPKASAPAAIASERRSKCRGTDGVQSSHGGRPSGSGVANQSTRCGDCVAAATPSDPPVSFGMRLAHSVACAEAVGHSVGGEAAGHDTSSCGQLTGGVCSPAVGLSCDIDMKVSTSTACACMCLYMSPCDENAYLDVSGMRERDVNRCGGVPGSPGPRPPGPGPLAAGGEAAQQAQWQCAVTMHAVDALVQHVMYSASLSTGSSDLHVPLCSEGPTSEPRGLCCGQVVTTEGALETKTPADKLEGRFAVDWDAVLFGLATVEGFPRDFKPVRVRFLCMRVCFLPVDYT